MKNGKTVLGWDASWTPHGSGAWAVVRGREVLMWEVTPKGGPEMNKRLPEVLETFQPELVAIDMPVGRSPVTGYREADRATTRAYSRYGCPVHSPTPERPGEWGRFCLQLLQVHGFEVWSTESPETPGIAEVYPHTAILEIKRCSYRLPYKVTRARSFWPEVSLEESRHRVRTSLQEIYLCLKKDLDVPEWREVCPPLQPLSALKAFEDRLDALICVWAGQAILSGRFRAYGDSVAAIWNPDLKNLDPPVRPS